MDNKTDIFIDFDDVIVKSTKRLIELLNINHREKGRLEDTKRYDLKDIYPLIEERNVTAVFNDKRFFDEQLEKFEGMENALRRFDGKFQYKIVTIGTDINLDLKQKWCLDNLTFRYQFIGIKNIYKNKASINMSKGVLIDDRAENLNHTNAEKRILFRGIQRDSNDIQLLKKTKTIKNTYACNDWFQIGDILKGILYE